MVYIHEYFFMSTGINVIFTYRVKCLNENEIFYTSTTYDLGNPDNENSTINNVCPNNPAHTCDSESYACVNKTLIFLPQLDQNATLADVITMVNKHTIIINYRSRFI